MTHELEVFLRQAEQELASEYQRITARSTEDPGTAGDEGEENWAELLRRWLPPGYRVVTKGRLLSVDGEASPQIDILVLKPSYPPVLESKKLYLAGGVAAAFEVKTTVKKSHLTEAITTAKEVQRLAAPAPPRSVRMGTPYLELHGPIVYGLLAHSHAWNANSAASHVTDVLEGSLDEAVRPIDVLDLVCVADLGFWRASKMAYNGPNFTRWHLDRNQHQFPEGYASCVIFGPLPVSETAEAESFPNIPVAQLCAYLYSRIAWEDPSLRAVSDYFRVAGVGGSGRGMARVWGLDDVFSIDVADRLKADGARMPATWDPWSAVFI